MWENPFKTFRHWHFKFISARGMGKEREERKSITAQMTLLLKALKISSRFFIHEAVKKTLLSFN
jgi:hypothetical protein